MMRAIRLQGSMENLPQPEKLEMKHSCCQTEPNETAEENDNLTTKINKCLLLLSHVNTKIDALATQLFQQPGTFSNDPINVKLLESHLQPVKSLADLEFLEYSLAECKSFLHRCLKNSQQ